MEFMNAAYSLLRITGQFDVFIIHTRKEKKSDLQIDISSRCKCITGISISTMSAVSWFLC